VPLILKSSGSGAGLGSNAFKFCSAEQLRRTGDSLSEEVPGTSIKRLPFNVWNNLQMMAAKVASVKIKVANLDLAQVSARVVRNTSSFPTASAGAEFTPL
jgi:hypothetical protein